MLVNFFLQLLNNFLFQLNHSFPRFILYQFLIFIIYIFFYIRFMFTFNYPHLDSSYFFFLNSYKLSGHHSISFILCSFYCQRFFLFLSYLMLISNYFFILSFFFTLCVLFALPTISSLSQKLFFFVCVLFFPLLNLFCLSLCRSLSLRISLSRFPPIPISTASCLRSLANGDAASQASIIYSPLVFYYQSELEGIVVD